MRKAVYIFLLGLFCSFSNPSYQIAVLKYRGGGDWYANPSSLTNLITFSNESIKTNIQSKYATVEVGNLEIFNYPFIHMTGHGNVVFCNKKQKI